MIRRSAWGRGFATEAAQAGLAWAWEHVATDHIISMTHPENAPSVRVAEKIGEHLERRYVENASEVCVYGVHRRESSSGARRQGAGGHTERQRIRSNRS